MGKTERRSEFIKPKPISEPDWERVQTYYSFYQLIKTHDFEDFKKNQIMTHVLGHERWSFRVAGISKAACREIAKCRYRRPGAYILERDHRTRRRADTYKYVFANELNVEDWWNYVWAGDETNVVTKKENRSSGTKPEEIIPLDWKEGFFEGTNVGFKVRVRTEGVKVRELCEEFNLLGPNVVFFPD